MIRELAMNTRGRWCIVPMLLLAVLALGGKSMSDLRSPSINESKQQVVDQETMQLLMILRDEQLREREPARVVEAIKRLGEMRSTSAIPDLIRLLTFKRTFEWESQSKEVVTEIQPLHIGNRYPATGALFQIGKPAIAALVELINAEEVGSVASENAIWVLTQIFREKLSDGVRYLKDAAANASSFDSKQRLSHAADRLQEEARKAKQAPQH